MYVYLCLFPRKTCQINGFFSLFFYTASERIKQLAKPIIRIAPKETDIKSDAYKVNPKALKAWCSPRIKKLAQHIVRN